MKTVTMHVDESVYSEFQQTARQAHCSTSELMRRAMRSYLERQSRPRPSLSDLPPPANAGRSLKPWSGREDLLDDYLERS